MQKVADDVSKTMNEYAATYKARLQQEELQVAYKLLVKYVMSLRLHFANVTKYQVGNVSPGYMDFTYFPFFDAFLRSKKLRFGVVLNHREMRFELWLMGQNAEVQKDYWNVLKNSKWNRNLSMPKYSVLETVLIDSPNFDNLERLSRTIEKNTLDLVGQIVPYLK